MLKINVMSACIICVCYFISGKKSIVKFLLQNGCDVLKQDSDGRTALHRAIINRHYDIAEMLSTICSDISSIKDNKHKLPRDYDEK